MDFFFRVERSTGKNYQAHPFKRIDEAVDKALEILGCMFRPQCHCTCFIVKGTRPHALVRNVRTDDMVVITSDATDPDSF